MIKTFYRLIIYFFSRFIKTDDISDKFPVSVKAIIIDDNKVLCLKNERNEWDFAGGKISFNEDVEDCLRREIKEETNLNTNNLNILNAVNLKFNDVSVIVLLYSANISCDSPIIISFEHSEYNFFSKSEIRNLNMPQYYKNLIEELI
jgi:ADP-ribose pyrophosphatase YjhB (NUDIX family)